MKKPFDNLTVNGQEIKKYLKNKKVAKYEGQVEYTKEFLDSYMRIFDTSIRSLRRVYEGSGLKVLMKQLQKKEFSDLYIKSNCDIATLRPSVYQRNNLD